MPSPSVQIALLLEKTKEAGAFALKERVVGHWHQDWIVPSLFVLGKPSNKLPKTRTADDMKCFASARAACIAFPMLQLSALTTAIARVALALWRLHVPDLRPTMDDVQPIDGAGGEKGASVPSWADLSKEEVCCCVVLG